MATNIREEFPELNADIDAYESRQRGPALTASGGWCSPSEILYAEGGIVPMERTE